MTEKAAPPSRHPESVLKVVRLIGYLHDSIEQELSSAGAHGALERFDSVRGLFREGDPIYPGSGFYERTHTQIAVRSLECIKGVFLPRL
jgi:hypothetical protein